MRSKYECKICSRKFIHKETLDEHNFLHGIIVHDDHRFSCPICRQLVSCQSGSHEHVSAEPTQCEGSNQLENVSAEKDDNLIDAKLGTPHTPRSIHNEISPSLNSEPSKTKKKLKSAEAGVDVAQSGAMLCNICNKSFVYLRCLLKHRATVHKDLAEDGRASGICAEDATVILSDSNVSINHDVGYQYVNGTDAGLSGDKTSVMPPDANIKAEDKDSGSDTDNDVDGSIETAIGVLAVQLSGQKSDETELIGTQNNASSKPATDSAAFTCKTCLKVFKYKTTLVRHCRVVHSGLKCDKCTCPVCSQIFDNQTTFSKHFDSAHRKKAAEMLSSLKVEENENVLPGENSATTTVDGLGVVRCVPCKQWFTCRRSLLKHCGLKHRVVKCPDTGKICYRCVHCGEMFDTDRQLVYHRHNKHYVNKIREDDLSLPSGNNESRVKVKDESKVDGLREQDGSNVSLSSDDETVQGSDSEQKVDGQQRQRVKAERFFCTECSKAFASMAFLTRHRKMKHGSKSSNTADKNGAKQRRQTFVCGLCSEEFDTEDALAQHVEFIHKGVGEEAFECTCPLCNCTCANQAAFSDHYVLSHIHSSLSNTPLLTQATYSVDQVVRCATCQLWFTNQTILQTHRCPKQTTARQPPKTGRARYRCLECGEAFEILRRFLHHRKVKHRLNGPDCKKDRVESEQPVDVQPVTSADLPAAVPVESPVPQLVRGRPPKEFGPAETSIDAKNNEVPAAADELSARRPRMPRGFARNLASDSNCLQCPECQRSFASVAQLRKHRKSEHRNRTCQLCGEVCKSADMVYYHNLKHHHEQKCEVCGASCSGRLGLIDHFRTQHPTEQPPLINRKTLICEYCPRVFAGCASRLLRDHIESCHLGRVHLCDVCGKRLGSAQTLAVHRRMHDPVARFACVECNRRFPHNTNLVNHIRKHHPERLPAKYVREFRCDVCSMQFGSSSGLTRHRTEKHGSMRFQCELCLRVFQSVTGMRVHKRRDHPQKDPEPPPPPLIGPFVTDPSIMVSFVGGLQALGQVFHH